MSIYLRRSVKVGPFRFSISKSGIGVSAGITGFRVGTGPRGNYVHMGRQGLYYRKTLASNSDGHTDRPAELPRQETAGTDMQEIESADVFSISDSSSEDLLAELNHKRRKRRLGPPVATLGVILLIGAALASWPLWSLGVIAVSAVLGAGLASRRDTLAKTTVLLYAFEPEMERAYETFLGTVSELAKCTRVWHIAARGDVHDRKYHAGASELVKRSPTTIRRAEPPHLRTNASTVAVGVGRQTLHFFPDRVLVYDPKGVGAVGYGELNVEVRVSRFIENETVPRDATVVDRTWRYVNKGGGPDRRFKANPELPICQYDEIDLTSSSGLNERLQVSRSGTGKLFARAISSLASKLPDEAASSLM